MFSWFKGLFGKKKEKPEKEKKEEKKNSEGETGKVWEVNEYGKYGGNAGNLDWTEVNSLLWVEKRSGELFKPGTVLLDTPDVVVKSCGVSGVEGDAVVTNRKKKLGAIYEFSLTISVSVKCKGVEEEAKGTFEMPYVTDDSSTVDDFGFELRMRNEGARKTFFKQGDRFKILQEKMDVLLKELQTGGPVRGNVTDESSFEKLKREEDVKIHRDKLVKLAQKEREEEEKRMKYLDLQSPSSSQSSSKGLLYKNFGVQISGKFDLPLHLIVDCFSNVERIASYTNSTCEMVDSKKFRLFGGSVSGEFVRIDSGGDNSSSSSQQQQQLPKHTAEIEMKWTQKEWTEGQESLVIIILTEKGNSTEVLLKHLNVPVRDAQGAPVKPKLLAGWKNNFFERIKLISGSSAVTKRMFSPRSGFVNFHSPRFMFGQ